VPILALEAGGSEVALQDLWRRHRDGDAAARERPILNYGPLVKVNAGLLHRRLPPHVEVDDLISAGLSGLLSAVERYDPLVGASFKHFGEFRIRGVMIDALRSVDWVPRSVRDHAREIEAASATLRSRLGRPAEEAELARELEMEVGELRRRLLQIDQSKIYSFDEPLGSSEANAPGALTLLDVEESKLAGPQQALDDGDGIALQKLRLTESIAELPESQHLVLACRYLEDLRLGEIADIMDLSESRISQLHTLALINVKATILGAAGRAEEMKEAHS
jgi:RNA polymerase sigma factor FliA